MNKEVRHKATITNDDPVHEYTPTIMHLEDKEVDTTHTLIPAALYSP